MGYGRYRRRRYRVGGRKRRRKSQALRYLSNAAKALVVAKQAYYMSKRLKRLVNVEFKKFDLDIGGLVTSTTGSVTHLTQIASGDTDQARDGNSVKCQSVWLKGHLARSASASTTIVRMIVFCDKQQGSDAAAGVTDVLDPSIGSGAEVYMNPLNNETVGRFQILSDKTIRLDDATGTLKMFQTYFKYNRHVRWNGTAAGDIQKNGLFLLLVSNESTNTPTINGNFRVTYTDN